MILIDIISSFSCYHAREQEDHDYAHMGLAKSRTRYSAFLDPKSDGRQEKMGRAYTHTYLVWTERGRKFIHDLAQRYLELCEVYS